TASVSGVTAGTWHLAVVTFENGQLRLYLDGSSNSSSETASYNTVGNHSSTANIGGQSGSAFGGGGTFTLGGLIDDVRVYDDIALQEFEVDYLYGQL
ncbi:MAG: LamG-like jellyroll fold domain-containing protein, partial [Planctomycetota bacterium]